MRINRKRALVAFAIAAVPAVAAATALAAVHRGGGSTGPIGVVSKPLVAATLPARSRAGAAGVSIATRGKAEVVTAMITVKPGGTFGWHTHPGPVVVAIAKGTLSLYQAENGRCSKRNVPAGQGFVENGGAVHLARNEGSTPVQLYATFFAEAGTAQLLTPKPDPVSCHV